MAISGTDFWTQFLAILEEGTGSTSNPAYYLPHEGDGIDGATAQEGEWANVITKTFERTAAGSQERSDLIDLLSEAGFFQPTDDLSFWKDQASAENALDVKDLADAAEERFPDMFQADAGGPGAGTSPSATGASTNPDGSTNTPGIMSGGVLTKINRPGEDPLWGYTYTVNGVQHVYTFDSFGAMQNILGDNAVTSGTYGFMQLDWDSVNDGDTWLLGDAGAFAGQAGSYATYFDDIMNEAALEAGVRNPGKLGEYLSDPAVQRIMAEGEAGGWSGARIQAEIRNTNYYQNVLYPGINKIMATGTSTPEQDWKRYSNSVERSLDLLGYQRDADGTFGSAVGEMLESGIQSDTFNQFAPTFVRAEQSQDFAGVLNQWTQNELGKDIAFEDWFDVLEGTAEQDLMGVVEKATIQYQAERADTQLSASQISRLAGLTDLSEAQMTVAFSNAEQALLSVGANDLARYGLTESALVNSAFGIETDEGDPLSTDGSAFTATEVQRRAAKAARELGIRDDNKASFFVGFTPDGRPQRQGLAAANPTQG